VTKKTRRRARPWPDGAADPAGALPSDRLPRSVTVKLDGEQRLVLGRCRRLLAGPEGESYPSVSRTIRLALSTLYHSLTQHPPTEEPTNGTTP
jgi:hypothetical protein